MCYIRSTSILQLILIIWFILPPVTYTHCTTPCRPHQYCCGANICCEHHASYGFWSMWYFWFIVVLLILTCIASCGYYRRRQRLLAMQGSNPFGVVVFTRGQNATSPGNLPPSYNEVVGKQIDYPPPYYSAGYLSNSSANIYNESTQVHPYLPPYPGPYMLHTGPSPPPLPSGCPLSIESRTGTSAQS